MYNTTLALDMTASPAVRSLIDLTLQTKLHFVKEHNGQKLPDTTFVGSMGADASAQLIATAILLNLRPFIESGVRIRRLFVAKGADIYALSQDD